MKIKQIHIQNFQRHANLNLNLDEGVNVITGLTDSGKSGVYRAIEWVFNFSSISKCDYRKEGTEETSVKIWLDNDFQVERIRTNSINRYILSKKDCEDKVFDSFGKVLPEELQKVLEIEDINIDNEHINLNFANQDQLNFILDSTYSDTFKAKLFNKLTGNEALDVVFKELNKEHLRLSKDVKETNENLIKQEDDLSEYSIQYKQSKKKLKNVQEKYKILTEEILIYEDLKDLNSKIRSVKDNEELLEFKKTKIKIISENKIKELKEKIEKLKLYECLSVKINDIKQSYEAIRVEQDKIKINDIDSQDLKTKNELLVNLQEINNNLNNNKKQLTSINSNKSNIEEELKVSEEELKKIWDECDVCPLCKGKKNNVK